MCERSPAWDFGEGPRTVARSRTNGMTTASTAGTTTGSTAFSTSSSLSHSGLYDATSATTSAASFGARWLMTRTVHGANTAAPTTAAAVPK